VDTIAGSGHWGQNLFVMPSRDLVIVRTGDDRDGSFDTDTFLRLVLEAFSSGGP
jgi:CubicO group peptidase (beta-lactamase class C family)